MKHTKYAAVMLTLSIALAGCGGGTGAGGADPDAPPVLPDPAEQQTPAAPPAEEKAQTEPNTELNPESQQEVPEPESVPEEEPAVVQNYYMDKNYMIRPKTPEADKKVFLLTFDDGPKDEAVLTSILDTLDQHQAKAIFFLNGYRIKQHPELVELIDERGQYFGNHSWDHINLKEVSEEELEKQIGGVQNIIQEITGKTPAFFRPPFGSGGDAVKGKAAEHGMLYMTWSNGSRDWEKNYQEPSKIIESVLEQLHAGSNILMHELPWTAEALDSLIKTLEEKGYSPVDPGQIDADYSAE